MSVHTISTWALANLIHPFIMLLFFALYEGGTWGMGSLSIMPFIFIFSVVVSLPALLLSRIFLGIIKHTDLTWHGKYALWLFAAPMAIVIELLVFNFISLRLDVESLHLFAPSIIATIIAILIRLKQFRSLFEERSLVDYLLDPVVEHQ